MPGYCKPIAGIVSDKGTEILVLEDGNNICLEFRGFCKIVLDRDGAAALGSLLTEITAASGDDLSEGFSRASHYS